MQKRNTVREKQNWTATNCTLFIISHWCIYLTDMRSKRQKKDIQTSCTHSGIYRLYKYHDITELVLYSFNLKSNFFFFKINGKEIIQIYFVSKFQKLCASLDIIVSNFNSLLNQNKSQGLLYSYQDQWMNENKMW